MIDSEGFNPLKFEATHITESTVSCIDRITNFVFSSTSTGITIERADYFPVFTITYDPNLGSLPDTIKVRDFKKVFFKGEQEGSIVF